MRLCRRSPLQQLATADGHAPDRAQRRIQQHHRLRRYLAELPCGADQRDAQLAAPLFEKVTPGNAGASRHQARQHAQQRPGKQGRPGHEQGHIERQSAGKDDPDEQGERARNHQRATQVVEHFPDAQCVNAVATGVPHQRKQLPVAACPAMVARRGNACMVRRVFDQHHVADKAATRNAALQQIVAQHGTLRQPTIEHGMHCLDIEQPLAAEVARAKHVLINIGDAAAVGVDATLPAKKPVIQRVLRWAGQGCDHPGLQDAIATDDPAQGAIDLRCVQRVRCNGHQFAQGAGRQARVAVQRDDIANAVCQPQRRSQWQKAVHVAGRQQAQQLLQLAAFALPAEPALLGFTPVARPVNEQKTRWAARWCRIACIQCRQPGQCFLQQTGVASLYGAGRIDPVGQQGKLGLVFAVGQPVKFKLLDQRLGGRCRGQQRWNDDQNAVLGRNAHREIEPRQGLHF